MRVRAARRRPVLVVAAVTAALVTAAGCSAGSTVTSHASGTSPGASAGPPAPAGAAPPPTSAAPAGTMRRGAAGTTRPTPGSRPGSGGGPGPGPGTPAPGIPTAGPPTYPPPTTGTTSRARWSGAVPLRPGEQPPQFVVVSFDGASWHPLMQHWLDAGRRSGATFTFFLSGIYLVPADHAAQLYRPPGHRPGASDIGFTTVPKIRVEIEDLRRAHASGHEIGTHFNGHFCGGNGVNRWTAAQWSGEIAQFGSFVDNWQRNTGITDVAPLPFTSADIQGGRTPCLEGRTSALLEAERRAGFRYDASRTGLLTWPRRQGGLWEFPLPSVDLVGTGRTVLAMDYNFYYAQTGASPAAPSARPALRRQVLASYRNAFDAVYRGNRAPLILGNHFNRWNGGIYTDALTDFLDSTCARPGVRCVSFAQLADWLDVQTPQTLARLQGLAAAH